MDNYCRLCAEEKVNLSNVSDLSNEILDWLLLVVNLDKDEISQKICYTCLCNIEEIGFFLKKCKESYENLKKICSTNNDYLEDQDDIISQNYSDEYLEEVLSDSISQDISTSWIEDNNDNIDNNVETEICIKEEEVEEIEENIKIEKIDIETNFDNYYGKFECEYCHVRFNSRSEKSEHTKEHNFFCTECGKNFPTKTKFNYHIANHKNKRDFQCSYCPKAFNHKSDLTNHLRFSHAGVERPRKYRCDLCDKNYCTPTELKIHLRFHRNERPYKCHLCDHTYVIKGHLQQHLKRHADIKDKLCSEPGCGKAYRDMSSLKKHMDIHLPDDNKKYTCDVCGRKFSFFYILSDHRRKSHRKIALMQPLKKEEIEN